MSEAVPRIPDDDRRDTPKTAAERPDWLVGADVSPENPPDPTAEPGGAAPFKLTSAAELSERREAIRSIPPPNTAPKPPAPPKPVAWTAAASSVPSLKVVSALTPAEPVAPRAAARAVEDALDAPLDDEPHDAFAAEDPAAPTAPAPAARVRLKESWWVVALDELRSNLKVQLAIASVILIALAVWIFTPSADRGTSLSALKKDPGRWDGKLVKVHGRVGDVFHVGGGCAFYLMQGRDTIVVFSRTQDPETNHSATVVGSVSTGYLDGQPRQAIFEQTR